VPILMLTAKTAEFDRVLGLELGADDYLTKPFSIMELQARVKAILRRADISSQSPADGENECLEVSGLRIDVGTRQVSIDGHALELTAREFDLLLHFARHPGRVYSRAQLLDQVWGYSHSGYEHTVNTHINRLRKKIESVPDSLQYIETVWGVGYRFRELAN
jgi:DNA-binding response OmpR family regulator